MSTAVETHMLKEAEVLPLPESPSDTSDTEELLHGWAQLNPAMEKIVATLTSLTGDDTESDPGADVNLADEDGINSTSDTSSSKSITGTDANDLAKTETSNNKKSTETSEMKVSRRDGAPEAQAKDKKELDKKIEHDTESNDESSAVADAKGLENEIRKDVASPAKAFFTDDVRPSALHTIHEHGCVSLKFGDYTDLFVEAIGADGRAYSFEVQSDVIAAASPIFHQMVYNTHKRGDKTEWKDKWTWELTDSAIGLKVLFCMLHHQYRAALFTQEPQPEQVYDVLRVLAKYGICDDAFHAYARSWISGFRKGLGSTTLTQLERLHTAHKLGDFKSLKVSLRKVAHEVEVGQGGVLCLDGRPIQGVVPITDHLIANIRAVRTVDVRQLLDPLQEAYDSLMGDAEDGRNYCMSSDGHGECNEKLLGSLLGALRRQGVRPIPVPASYTGSVGALAAKVSEMKIRGLYVPHLVPHHQRHNRCKLDQDEVAQQLVDCKSYLPIYDNLVEEMVVLAKRAGIVNEEKEEFEEYKNVFNTACVKYHEEFCQNSWGWGGDIKSTDNDLFPVDDSGIGEGELVERKLIMEIIV